MTALPFALRSSPAHGRIARVRRTGRDRRSPTSIRPPLPSSRTAGASCQQPPNHNRPPLTAFEPTSTFALCA